jgi:hypothetical protein
VAAANLLTGVTRLKNGAVQAMRFWGLALKRSKQNAASTEGPFNANLASSSA